MMYIFIRSKIHRSTITMVARPQFAGSVEPATRANNIILLATIKWHYAIYRFTDYIFLFFFFLCSIACLFHCLWKPANKCAKKTRQMNAPKWPKISCRENLPDSPTRITRPIYLPEKPAISTRGLLARESPFPAQNPQAGPGPPTLPPPQLRQLSGGGGRELARPTHAYWTGTFPFFPHLMNGYIFLYNTAHTYSTQSGLHKV